MKTLVLCVDRDDDLGAKGGIKGPVIGREETLHAANRLGLADPEDSDVNTMLSAIALYDELVRGGTPAEIATITGDVRVGQHADRNLTKQIDEVIEWVRPDRAYLVSDGAEDEAIFPMIASRLRIDHVKRVYVRQAPAMESAFYTLVRLMKDPKVRTKFVVPFALSLILFGFLVQVQPTWALTAILVVFGFWLLLGSMPMPLGEMLAKPGELYERVRRSVVQGNVSLFFNLPAFILFLVGLLFGLNASNRVDDYVAKFLVFVGNSVFWLMLAILTYEGGKVSSAYLQRGRVPSHVLVVAATIIALGLLTLALTKTLSAVFGQESLNVAVIGGTMGVAVFLVIFSLLAYRSQRDLDVEDAWRF